MLCEEIRRNKERIFRWATVVVGLVGPLAIVWTYGDWWGTTPPLGWLLLESLMGLGDSESWRGTLPVGWFLYALLLALGTSTANPRTTSRWIGAAVVGIWSTLFAPSLDVIVITFLIVAAGLCATGKPPESGKSRGIIDSAAYGGVRAMLMLAVAVVVILAFYAVSDKSPDHGNVIVSTPLLFLLVTYSVILTAIAYDKVIGGELRNR